MWNRFGLALVVLAAVVAAFVAGAIAPPGWRVPLAGASASLLAAGTAIVGRSADGASAPGSGVASAAPAASAAASSVVPFGALLRDANGDAAGSYALLVGRFGERDSADRSSAGIAGQGVPSRVILVEDDARAQWAVVTAGRFASAAEALSQRQAVANRLGLSAYLPVIRLPVAASSPSSTAGG